jgi:AcrR family transcriptional regulator
MAAEDRRAEPNDVRRHILGAATAEITRHGVSGLRVRRVAQAAGVSASLLYYHFGSRTGLIHAALSELPGADRTPAQEAPLTAALLRELDASPDLRAASVLRGEAAATAVFDPGLRPALWTQTAGRQATVAEAIERDVAAADADLALVARQLVALVDGLRERWLAEVVPLPRARALVAAAVDALLGPR